MTHCRAPVASKRKGARIVAAAPTTAVVAAADCHSPFDISVAHALFKARKGGSRTPCVCVCWRTIGVGVAFRLSLASADSPRAHFPSMDKVLSHRVQ